MYIKDIIYDLHQEGYNNHQIIEHIKEIYDIEMSIQEISKIANGIIKRHQEIQNHGNRKWQRLTEICPKSEFYKFYKKNNELSLKDLYKKYNFTLKECNLLRIIYNSENTIDMFDIATTKKIFEEDKRKCRRCKKVNKLETHHIRPRGGEHFENGILLCRNCHSIIHLKKLFPRLKKYDRNNWEEFAMKDTWYANSYKKPKRTTKISGTFDKFYKPRRKS